MQKIWILYGFLRYKFFLEFYTVWYEFCRQQQWRAQYSSFLKGTIWTTLNASMLTINQRGKNPSMVIGYIITSHKFCILHGGFLHNWERAYCLDSVYVLFNCVACFCLQTCSWMWRAAKMFMSLLTSMLKLRGLRVKTSTRLNSLVCRLGLLWKLFFISIFTSCSSLWIKLDSGYVQDVSLTVDSRLWNELQHCWGRDF